MDDNILTHICLGGVIEWVDEVHHIQAPLTKCATNGWPSGGTASWNTKLQVADNFFCHYISFYSITTGIECVTLLL